ncbi:hypothetical protein A2U01_0041072, partial [Trifolium medium]|nr:hypothetical protein [Trifolium medium]
NADGVAGFEGDGGEGNHADDGYL